MSDPVTIQQCLSAVSDVTGVPLLDLISHRRSRWQSRPRQIAMWVARHTTVASLPMIGRAIGDRDHTTILHGIRTVERMRKEEPDFAAVCDAVLRRVRHGTDQLEIAL